MNIKNSVKIFFVINLLTFFVASSKNLDKNKVLYLKHVKCKNWSLTRDFLKKLTNLFGTTIFVESGTYTGKTTSRASNIFREVYSIELEPHLYHKAKQKLKNKKNVHLYLGDSSKVLPKILSQIDGKILFWLDGHYSGGATAKGEKNTPIIEELEAIKKSGIKNSIILIDDLRCFQPVEKNIANDSLTGYPKANELKNLILDINENYQFKVFGDIAIAYPKSSGVLASPIINACTKSRLSENDKKITLEELFSAEKTISKAQGKEKIAIELLYKSFLHSTKYCLGKHYHLWYALTLAASNQTKQAIEILNKAKGFGFSYDRISYYLELFEKSL